VLDELSLSASPPPGRVALMHLGNGERPAAAGRIQPWRESEDELDALCGQLAAAIESAVGGVPDVVIGIAQGGSHVADRVCRLMPTAGRIDVRVCRPGTAVKEALHVRHLLSRLPAPLTNLLRVIEVYYREVAWHLRRRSAERKHESLEVASVLGANRATLRDAAHVVIVDDTVDSGKTLATVRDEVRRVSPAPRVWTAVITSTWRRPPMVPDVVLMDRVLVRFPWSHDAR
jgi:hypoxanthine phosphoribosyltransferase